MKDELIGGILLLLLMLLLPALVTVIYNYDVEKEIESVESKDFSVKLRIESTGEIQTMDLESYIVGVVAAEMPASYEEEALKAQAVAARTYAYRKIVMGTEILSTDFRNGQAFLTEQELKERWGENYLHYMKKISDVVKGTKGQILVYKDEPIEAVFHAMSAGMTQASEDVWSFDLPYLQSVNSSYDTNAPQYEVKQTLSEEEAKTSLYAIVSGLQLTDEPLATQMKILERNDGGYIKSIQVGNKTISGEELRRAFGARSSNMIISQAGEEIRITTKGYGHGAGMSQYGANEMSKQGYNHEDILQHYYIGTKIGSIN